MIHEVDRVLRELLSRDLIYPGSVLTRPDQIVIGLPAESRDEAAVCLILHEIKENSQLRDESFHIERDLTKGTARKRRSKIWMNLGYLIAVVGGNPADGHRLLADVTRSLFVNESVPASLLVECNELDSESGMRVSVAQEDIDSHKKIESLWRAFQKPMIPSLAVVVTAAFNPYRFLPDIPLVREVISVIRRIDIDAKEDSAGSLSALRGSIIGYLTTDDGRTPVPGACVKDLDNGISTISDEDGAFMFLGLTEGTHRFDVSAEGMAPCSVEAVVPPDGRLYELAPLHISLSPSTSSSRLVGSRSSTSVRHKLVSGTLRYPDGEPAPFIPIRIGTRKSATNGKGLFAIVAAIDDHDFFGEVPGLGEVQISTDHIISRPPVKIDVIVP